LRILSGLLAAGLIVAMLFLLYPTAAKNDAPALPAAPQGLSGIWRPAQVWRAGVPQGAPENMRFTFTDNLATLTVDGLPPFTVPYQVDATRTPKEITLATPQGMRWPGIYRFEGKFLQLCLNHRPPDQPEVRPTEFVTDPATPTIYLYQLER